VETDRLPKITRDGALEGKNTPGRGHDETLAQCIKQSLARKKTEETEWKEMAVQKEQWRSKIREFTDGTSARITGKSRKKFVEAWVLHPDLLIGRRTLKQPIEGRRSGRQMAIVIATQKRENEGEEGRERREKGQCTAQKSGRGVHARGCPNRRSAKE
jgi:hypothetical protein